VTKERSLWKHYTKNERVSKRLSFHHWHGWVYVPKGCSRDSAVGCGWVETKAKNKWLLWKDRFGRLEWQTSGRVKVWIRKPASIGKAAQLLANAFHMTGLIPDIRVFEIFRKTLKFKGAHAVLEVGERLPYFNTDILWKSNGVKVKGGDISHPTGLEIEFCLPDWAERNEQLFERLLDLFEGVSKPKIEKPTKEVPYRV
jgi:hypothetical protein